VKILPIWSHCSARAKLTFIIGAIFCVVFFFFFVCLQLIFFALVFFSLSIFRSVPRIWIRNWQQRNHFRRGLGWGTVLENCWKIGIAAIATIISASKKRKKKKKKPLFRPQKFVGRSNRKRDSAFHFDLPLLIAFKNTTLYPDGIRSHDQSHRWQVETIPLDHAGAPGHHLPLLCSFVNSVSKIIHCFQPTY
jgi:hypothetical protein